MGDIEFVCVRGVEPGAGATARGNLSGASLDLRVCSVLDLRVCSVHDLSDPQGLG
jgi:hypothetical protein